jgi:hypothetical protein
MGVEESECMLRFKGDWRKVGSFWRFTNPLTFSLSTFSWHSLSWGRLPCTWWLGSKAQRKESDDMWLSRLTYERYSGCLLLSSGLPCCKDTQATIWRSPHGEDLSLSVTFKEELRGFLPTVLCMSHPGSEPPSFRQLCLSQTAASWETLNQNTR